jgi:flavin reductase (DIM6/NTAB) family NADH-FMN oxidoreductase RutF
LLGWYKLPIKSFYINLSTILIHFTNTDLQKLERFYRANLVNSVSGYKSANLIGTVADDGHTNLAVFSSLVHLGADPALLAFIQRPLGESGHTYHNIKQNGYYTINHIHRDFVEKAHYTSAKFDREVSEFEACQLTPEWLKGFAAPFVKESQIKIGMRFVQEIPITLNNTIMVIGQIEHIFIAEHALQTNGNVALGLVSDVCISGLECYHDVTPLAAFPYAKTTQLPDFSR